MNLERRVETGENSGLVGVGGVLTHLDLFSGIGGFALAARWAGFRTVAFCEIHEYAKRVLKRRWPDVPNLGDIRNVRGVRADLVTGGFPCQPFSMAGKRRGTEDDRHLWPEMLRVIKDARPAWIVGENTPGIVGVALDGVLSDLEAIGYSARPFIIPACAVGAYHRRERVWIVAHANGEFRNRINSPKLEPRHLREVPPDGDRNKVAGGAVDRAADGLSYRLDRLHGLGNSIDPRVAFPILRGIAALMGGGGAELVTETVCDNPKSQRDKIRDR